MHEMGLDPAQHRLAQKLASEIRNLRPSQLLELADWIKDENKLQILLAACEMSLADVLRLDDEVVERAYVFGIEVRNILLRTPIKRFYPGDLRRIVLEVLQNWQGVKWPVQVAFVTGLEGGSLEAALAGAGNWEGEFNPVVGLMPVDELPFLKLKA